MHFQQKNLPQFRIYKLNNTNRRGFVKSSLFLKAKTKPISKHSFTRCEKTCSAHSFSLTKVIRDNKSLIDLGDCSVRHRFCPQFDQSLLVIEGGIPTLRLDKRIDTPAFASYFSSFTSTDDQIYRERYVRLVERAQLINCEQKQPTVFVGNQQCFKRCSMDGSSFDIKQLQQILLRRA